VEKKRTKRKTTYRAEAKVDFYDYGDIVIDSPLNRGYACSLACNASLGISQNPHECLKLAKKIYEVKLLKYK